MGLAAYRQKRRFDRTPEPGPVVATHGGSSFVVQKHAASHLHYDFRLELDGTLKSWAVPKGPSLDPEQKRLAMEVEDHPVSYRDFEGIIPAGEYGGGTVIVWDKGTWVPHGDARKMLAKGHLSFDLEGEKLHGRFALVRLRGDDEKKPAWLLMKSDDAHAEAGRSGVVENRPESVLSGKTIDEVANDTKSATWRSNRRKSRVNSAEKPKRRAPQRASSPGTKEKMPDFSPPELATLVKAPPVGDEWVHEVKYDGYRALVHVKGGRSVVHTRRGQDWTDRFEEIAAAAAALPVEGAIFDGEIVALRADGISDFGALQAAMGAGGAGRRLVCFVFDLLHLDGRNLRELPLHERKSILESLFAAAPENGVLRLSQHITGRGEEILRNACKMGLEGIVSKLQSSTYEAGRGKSWLKSKCQVRQELVVGGYSEPTGGRRGIGALLVGYHDAKNGLVYAGKVGTGFTAQTLQDLKARLGPLEVSKSPFRSTPREKGVHWVKPTTVVEVELTEWTKDGKLRHPSFKGVREDKRAKDVTRELPKPAPETASKPSTVSPPRRASSRAKGSLDVAGVAISNAAKLLYPADGVSKGDVARYYEAVASHMLPHLARRPLTLVRCPSGSGKSCFFQKHLGAHPPASLHPIAINRGEEPYFYVDSAEGLVSLAQMGALEAHVWGSHIDTLEKPDLLVMDLDPDEGLPWPAVAQAARDLRDVFQHLGLHPFVKTTGGKGLHVVVPCKPSINWDETKSFTKSIADMLVRAAPDRYTANMAKAKRKGKIFVDYLRNGRSATAIAPYSTRAREHATVAMPISWDELSRVKPESFTTKTVPALLARRDDPWAGFFEAGRAITPRTIGALLKL